MTRQKHIQRILSGKCELSEHPQSTLSITEIATIARSVVIGADLPGYFPRARHLAIEHGYRLIPRAPRGLCGEGANLGRIAYKWLENEAEREVLIGHGFAHCIANQLCPEANHTDVWILTAFLLIPPYIERFLSRQQIIDGAHTPQWFTEARIELVTKQKQIVTQYPFVP